MRYRGFCTYWTIYSMLSWICPFLPFILGAPFSYFYWERKEGRKEGRSRGWKWGKGDHSKVNETPGFCTWGIPIGPLPVNLNLSQKFSTSLLFILGAPFSYYCKERKDGSSRGRKWGKGILQKWMTPRDVWLWSIQTGLFAAWWTYFGEIGRKEGGREGPIVKFKA